ncbi:MAG: hypothetical protein Q7J10_09240 [Methanosarcinaceae archaeon]|nr:hypothetical protein [Methanosarcinaceae archaeon]
MKYILFIMITLAIMVNVGFAQSENQSSIFYFYSGGCGACESTGLVLDTIESGHSDVVINRFDIDTEEGWKIWGKYQSVFNVIEYSNAIPMIFVGDDFLCGYSTDLEDKVLSVLGNYSDGTIGTLGDKVFENPEDFDSDWFYDEYLGNGTVDGDFVNVYIFLTSSCFPCNDLEVYVDQKTWDKRINIHKIPLYTNDYESDIFGEMLLTSFKNAFNEPDLYGLPLIFIRDDYYVGYYGNLDEIVNSYLGVNSSRSISDAVYSIYDIELKEIAHNRAEAYGGVTVQTEFGNDEGFEKQADGGRSDVRSDSIWVILVFLVLVAMLVKCWKSS